MTYTEFNESHYEENQQTINSQGPMSVEAWSSNAYSNSKNESVEFLSKWGAIQLMDGSNPVGEDINASSNSLEKYTKKDYTLMPINTELKEEKGAVVIKQADGTSYTFTPDHDLIVTSPDGSAKTYPLENRFPCSNGYCWVFEDGTRMIRKNGGPCNARDKDFGMIFDLASGVKAETFKYKK